jgi:hypothetical protein
MPDTFPSVVGRIESIVESIPGWTPADELFALFNLAYASAEMGGDVIEIGSWCGRSAVVLGTAAQLANAGSVHCIDLFPEREEWLSNEDGTYSIAANVSGKLIIACNEHRVWSEPFERDIAPLYNDQKGILDIFNQNIKCFGLEDVVRPFRGTSQMFADSANASLSCRLAFIDGDHGFASVCSDIASAEKFLAPNGWLCLDDAHCGNPGVDEAIENRILYNPAYCGGIQLTRKLFVTRRVATLEGV